MSSAVLLPASFAILLAGALLFTNAIEWFGSMVNLGQGAVGSLLAAVATALPESLIPVVAIIGAEEGSDDVAVGAIVGAPLLLATIAMALVGLAAVLYRDRRPQALALDVHAPYAQTSAIAPTTWRGFDAPSPSRSATTKQPMKKPRSRWSVGACTSSASACGRRSR